MKKIPTLFLRDQANPKVVTREPHPDCGWVFRGEGAPTRKIDGTSCLQQDGRLWKRYELRLKKAENMATAFAGAGIKVHILGWAPKGPYPREFVPAQSDAEPETKHGERKLPGWVPVGDGPEDRWHREGFFAEVSCPEIWPLQGDGSNILPVLEKAWGTNGETFELIGPKVNGNPERVDGHWLIPHRSLAFCNACWWTECKAFMEDTGRGTIGPLDAYELLRHFLEKNPMEGLVFHHPDGRMAKLKRRDLGLPWPVKG